MRNNTMDIDNIHLISWIPDRKPQPSRGVIVPMAPFPLSGWICLLPRIPGFHSPPAWHSWWRTRAKKPESHSWAKDCSQIPSAFRFPVQKIKSPKYSLSHLPCLKSRWNISCLVFFCSKKWFSTCILEFLTGKMKPGPLPSLLCCITGREGIWSLPGCSCFAPQPHSMDTIPQEAGMVNKAKPQE